MEKSLNYFTDEALVMFKENKELFCEQMRLHPNDTDWIDNFYGSKAMVPSTYKFDFEFKPFYKDAINEDYENAVAMYELFKEHNLGPATIYNEKFLTGFIFTFGYKYFMEVIGADQVSHVFGTLFFDEGQRRAIARNTIGRLYRYVELTIDESLEDKYEITKFAFENKNLFRIRYYTYFDGITTHRAYFKAFKRWYDKTKGEIKLSLVQKVITHLSVLSNVSDTDLMTERDLVDYLVGYISRAAVSK